MKQKYDQALRKLYRVGCPNKKGRWPYQKNKKKNKKTTYKYHFYFQLIYNYDNLGLLAKMVGENIVFISDLSIGQQLEHGLF